MLKRFSTFLETLLWPRECALCRTRLESGALCGNCRSKLQILPWMFCSRCDRRLLPNELCVNADHRTPLRGLGVSLRYDEPPVKEVIWAYKYRRRKDLAEEFVKILVLYAEQELSARLRACRPTVVPMPLHPKRERERGFNQAELIAKPFAEYFGYDYRNDILYRTKNSPPQAKIESAQNRRDNISGAFSARFPQGLNVKTVILVDDVASTGATLEEAARTLRRAGSHDIWGLVIARGQ